MKKLLFITVFFFSYIWVSAQTMKDSIIIAKDNIFISKDETKNNPELKIEIGSLVIYVSSGTFSQQIQDIAKRTVDPPYNTTFDFAFFDTAVVILEQLSKEKKEASSEIMMLKKWRNYLSFDGNKLLKEEYERFLIQTKEDYRIAVVHILATDTYDLLQLGKCQVQILKETYGTGKKKVEVPVGYYCMIAMKQPLN